MSLVRDYNDLETFVCVPELRNLYQNKCEEASHHILGPESVVIRRGFMSTKRALMLTSDAALNAAKNHAEAFLAKKQAAEKSKKLKRHSEDETIARAERVVRGCVRSLSDG